MIYFVDTNFFLQCYDYKNLKWDEITKDPNIEIFISRAVQIEIDRLKNDGNYRRSKKARNANTLFRKILLSKALNLTDTCGNKTLIIKFAENYKITDLEKQNKSLDISRPDDEIIATILKFNSDNNTKAELLTHDTNPILTSKKCNSSFQMIPESWILPPENDKRDKQLLKLQSQIKTLNTKIPKLNCSLTLSQIHIVDNKVLLTIKDPVIGNSDIKKLMEYIKSQHPIQTEFDTENRTRITQPANGILGAYINQLAQEYKPPSKEKIIEYKSQCYPSWLSEMEKSIKKLVSQLKRNRLMLDFSICLDCCGIVPVDNLLFEIEVSSSALLLKEKNLSIQSFRFPEPPEPPKGKWISKIFPENLQNILSSNNSYLNNFPLPILPNQTKKRDKYSFYWYNYSDQSNKWQFQCEEFRHNKKESFDYWLELPTENKIDKLYVKINASGSNMPKQFIRTFNISLKYEEFNPSEEILALLKK